MCLLTIIAGSERTDMCWGEREREREKVVREREREGSERTDMY